MQGGKVRIKKNKWYPVVKVMEEETELGFVR